MSAKEPIIKFSPFEALLIGEKNKILKRQPMKNTIFVTRLNQRSKTINLRDLFGLEKSTKTENNDVIFKMPQRVCDFLKHRKLQNKRANIVKDGKDEILCYEFEGCKMVTKNNETLLPKGKNLFVRLNKIKFKQRFKYKGNLMHKIVKKFPSPTRKRNYNYCESKCRSLTVKNKNKIFNGKKHTLRGKDGKFICKKDYENLTKKSREFSPKQKYLSNYLHQLYLKKNKQLLSSAQLKRNGDSPDDELPYSVEAVIGLPNLQFDITASEAILNEVSKKYYKKNFHEDFQFPQFPKQLQPLDFESDSNLVDIIYENFPKIVRFESSSKESDFSTTLLNCQILKSEKIVKMYEKKKNGFVKDEAVRQTLERRFPVIKLRRINEIVPNMYPLKNGKAMFQSEIDEPYTKKSHLITSKSFGNFFFQSAEGKDIFIGNLIKPFWQNSWFGSLPES